MSATVLIPDTEALVSAYLRAAPELAALVGERVYTAVPAKVGAAPFLLVQRIGGTPLFSRPLVLDEAELQLDAWGGTKRDALTLMETARQLLVLMPGQHALGVVSAVGFGALRWQPDGTYEPPRPRYVADMSVWVKPSAAALASPVAAETEAVPVSTAGR